MQNKTRRRPNETRRRRRSPKRKTPFPMALFFVIFLVVVLFVAGIVSCTAQISNKESSSSSEESSSVSQAAIAEAAAADLDQNASARTAETSAVSSQPQETGTKVFLPQETPVYEAADTTSVVTTLPAGTTVSVETEGASLWFPLSASESVSGYLYGEMIYAVNEDGTASEKNLTDAYILDKLQHLKITFPQGKYWNHVGYDIPFGEESPQCVTDTPCDHTMEGETYCNIYSGRTLELFPEYEYLCQCLGFASYLSDQIFGAETDLHVFYDPSLLQIGDHIRLHDYEHSMIVVEITDYGVKVAEANEDYEDCLISWSRQISFDELASLSWDIEFITRYPMYQNENGSWQVWDDWETE